MIEERSRRRYQAMGIAFLVVAGLFLAGTIGMYNKAFTRFVAVTVRADTAGNQMMPGADVKVRGVVVGEVRAIDAGTGRADLRLALHPDKAEMIPANASARLLPKTLFGERYVSLDIPERAAATTLQAGDVIPQDRSASAMEVEKVLDDLMPVLQAVQPQQVATTLNAVSQALEGRGDQLGQTLVQLDTYLQDFNPSLPKLESVIGRIDDVAENYADAAPDLLQAVNDLTTTSRTIVEQRDQLRTMISTTTSASTEVDQFLAANSNNFIRLAGTSRETLELLAKYSPEYSCVLRQFHAGIENGDKTFGKGTDTPTMARMTLEFTGSRGKYLPGRDDHQNLEQRGPRCYPFVEPPDTFPQYPPDGPLEDGSVKPEPPMTRDQFMFPWKNTPSAPASTTTQSASASVANSRPERDLLAALMAPQLETDPKAVPDWSSLLVGPLFRGAEVTLR
ncbi:MCE family protein [Saccharopolyspora rhizosphaerae]|uniref:MCE family protein n=1 Tax=Saccharopolyspora rhizosphaerae TaxID=2492662 RepID=A0A3R8VHD1_9PSEU|nr:MCE family protein [Saccharopolyspora rhizosphaerae]RRO17505.1 MCE family protein [Saccharopolyspora rhizosphaerae]